MRARVRKGGGAGRGNCGGGGGGEGGRQEAAGELGHGGVGARRCEGVLEEGVSG